MQEGPQLINVESLTIRRDVCVQAYGVTCLSDINDVGHARQLKQFAGIYCVLE